MSDKLQIVVVKDKDSANVKLLASSEVILTKDNAEELAKNIYFCAHEVAESASIEYTMTFDKIDAPLKDCDRKGKPYKLSKHRREVNAKANAAYQLRQKAAGQPLREVSGPEMNGEVYQCVSCSSYFAKATRPCDICGKDSVLSIAEIRAVIATANR